MCTYNMCASFMKKNVMIRIDEELVRKAKDIGLNISKISENALKSIIEEIESPNPQSNPGNNPEKGGTGTVGSDWCGCRDLNPGLQAWKA